MSIRVDEPRMLIVRVAAPRIQMLCLSLHGPHSDCMLDHCAVWTRAGNLFIKLLKLGDVIAVFIDSNCRISFRHGDSDQIVGPLLDPPWRHNSVSDAFIKFCRRANHSIPNTFYTATGSDVGAGSLRTSTGFASRYDHVLLDAKVFLTLVRRYLGMTSA